jgi:hypothetical protein
MSPAKALFHSELREAVRQARTEPQVAPAPAAVTQRRRTVVRLWLPLTPLWVVLAPFALLISPLMALIPALRGAPPIRTAITVGAALIALSGTVIDVNSADARVHIRIL